MADKKYEKGAEAADGYACPSFDALEPKQKKVALHFSKHHDMEAACLHAGYSPINTPIWAYELGQTPVFVKAVEELNVRKLNAADNSRASVVERLMSDSTVSMSDLCHEVETDDDGRTTTKWWPKASHEIEPQYRSSASLVTVSREGNAQMNNTAQGKAREQLAKFMNWDKDQVDTNAAIHFDFSGLKDLPAED
jgi:hypothetical protein